MATVMASLKAFRPMSAALHSTSTRQVSECQLVDKATVCEASGEPVRRFVFRAPQSHPMNVDTGLRQVVVVRACGQLRMYSPTTEPNRTDGTFELLVRVYPRGLVSRWLDNVAVGQSVSMTWPFPSPLQPDRRNPGKRVGLVAFGMGITELYRVAVNELGDGEVEEVVLLHSTRTVEEQLVLCEELGHLMQVHGPRFRLERTLTRESVPECRQGRVTPAMLAEVFPWDDPQRDNVRFLAAGSREMIQEAMVMLDSLGYRRETYKLIRDHRPSAL